MGFRVGKVRRPLPNLTEVELEGVHMALLELGLIRD
jgi:hypothetical protein